MIHLCIWLTVKNADDVETVKELLTQAGKLSQAEPGCRRFEVYHSQNDRQVFTLSEHWENKQSLDGHRQGEAYTTIYQPKVLPLVDRTPHPSDLLT